MSHVDAIPDLSPANDVTLLQGLYPLAVSGHSQEAEFRQLDRVV